jgi:iron-sulfur cluster assembly protein
MLEVTGIAVNKLKTIIKEQGEEGAALRVVVVGMGCSGPQFMLTLDREQSPEDAVEDFDGLRFLVDPDTAVVAEGSKIDYVEDLMRTGFIISNPRLAGSGGGCGNPNCGCRHGE